jgi:D-glycero-D-manno-heptose 1,7-bisphosphate phosphatase
VFLDRDGTIIADRGYLDTVEGVCLLPGAGTALANLAGAGLLLVIVTNQSGIGRGFFDRQMVDAQHRRLGELLAPYGVRLAAVEVCPHRPDEGCDCRKPQTGMLERAARRLDVDLRRSFMVGDKASDMAAGRAAGCVTVLIGQKAEADVDLCCRDLPAAARDILSWMAREERIRTDGR